MLSSQDIDRISPGVDEAVKQANAWYWAYTSKIWLVPGLFTLDGHEFQVRPMSIRPPVKVVKKGTQMTFTETEVLSVIHDMRYGLLPQGCLYLFPSKDEVTDFSSSRFAPLIKDNPDTIGAYIHDTNRANLKRIGNGFIFFRSGRLQQEIRGDMKSSSHLKSLPADHAVHDEYDEMHPGIDEYVDGRLAKSKVKTKSYLANPTLPDYGIDAKFQLSDQEYWHVKCQACGEYTCFDLDDNFPNLFHRQHDGSVIRACRRCGRLVDVRLGEWVAMKPSITDIIGFTIGRPSAYWSNPAELLNDWQNPNVDKANFTRLRLGRAYIEAENRLSLEEIYDCCGDNGIESSNIGPCFMGVDQGKDLHVVIGDDRKVVHLEVYKDWEEMDRLVKVFNVSRCVVDALPETRNARAFAERNKGKAYLNYYNEHQKGSYAWKQDEMIVSCNRTESLDASHQKISLKKIGLPKRCEIVEEFASHCHNVAKKLEEDEETGSKWYVYVKLGPDHFRHAFNYFVMAKEGYGRTTLNGMDLT